MARPRDARHHLARRDEADAANSITIPRPVISGNVDDTDVFGGQQYGSFVALEIP